MKWKVAVWSGLAVTLLLGCSSREEVAHERAPNRYPSRAVVQLLGSGEAVVMAWQ